MLVNLILIVIIIALIYNWNNKEQFYNTGALVQLATSSPYTYPYGYAYPDAYYPYAYPWSYPYPAIRRRRFWRGWW